MEIPSKRVVLPAWIGLTVRALPLPLMNLTLRRLIVAIRRGHPDLLDRMGTHASACFLIDPLDLPILFLVRPANPAPVTCLRRPTACIAQCARSNCVASGPVVARDGVRCVSPSLHVMNSAKTCDMAGTTWVESPRAVVDGSELSQEDVRALDGFSGRSLVDFFASQSVQPGHIGFLTGVSSP